MGNHVVPHIRFILSQKSERVEIRIKLTLMKKLIANNLQNKTINCHC